MLFLWIERMFGLIDGCKILGRIFFKLVSMILVHSKRKDGHHLRERED
jgi:hypothetical protein